VRRPRAATVRAVVFPVVLVVAYPVLLLALSALSEHSGFGSPDGLGPSYLAVAVAVLVLRVLLLIVVPAVLAYRGVVLVVTGRARITSSGTVLRRCRR
jgi:hypothetical protein